MVILPNERRKRQATKGCTLTRLKAGVSWRESYEELDANIVNLVRALNAFPGVATIGSCGGHENPGPGQWDAGTWYVLFEIDQTPSGWRSLEFLGWAINNDMRRADRKVIIYPTSPPPYLNEPGEMLRFAFEGIEEDPEKLASWIEELHQKYYVPAVLTKRYKKRRVR